MVSHKKITDCTAWVIVKRIIVIFHLLLVIIIVTVSGCDTNGSTSKDKGVANQFAFVDSSEGLPLSGVWRHDLSFYDINDDGHIDIFAPPPRKATKKYDKPLVWYGNDKGNWTESRLDVPSDIDYDYGSIAVSDFDGDGIVDIALAMHCIGMKVLRGTGQGKYVNSEGLPALEEFASRAVVADDFNNDGRADIAAVSEAPFTRRFPVATGVRVFFNSDNRWRYRRVGDEKEVSGLFADKITTGDVNGDGNRDIAVASLVTWLDKIVWIGDGKGGFAPFNDGLPKKRLYYSVAFVDINKDGRDDLVGSVSAMSKKGFLGLKAFLSGADGFQDISEGLPANEWFAAVDACDLDGDGAVEIVGGTGEGGLKVFSQKGNRWVEVKVSGLPKKGMVRIWNIYCIDLNKDGYKDIVINHGSYSEQRGGISVFLNSPDKH